MRGITKITENTQIKNTQMQRIRFKMYLEDHYLRKKKMVKRSDMTVNEVTSERRKYREETLLEDIIAPNTLNY